jgi:hypothetical protein
MGRVLFFEMLNAGKFIWDVGQQYGMTAMGSIGQILARLFGKQYLKRRNCYARPKLKVCK